MIWSNPGVVPYVPETPSEIFWNSVHRQLGEALPNLGLNLLTLGWYGVYQRYNYYEDVNNVPSSYGGAFSESLDATPIAGSVKAAINADTGLERAGHISSAVGQGILLGVAAYKIAAGPKPTTALVKYDPKFAMWQASRGLGGEGEASAFLALLGRKALPEHAGIYGDYITVYRGINGISADQALKFRNRGFLSGFWRKKMIDILPNEEDLLYIARQYADLMAEVTTVQEHVLGKNLQTSVIISTTKRLSIAKGYATVGGTTSGYIYKIKVPRTRVLNPYDVPFWKGKIHPKPQDYEIFVLNYIQPEYIVDYWPTSPKDYTAIDSILNTPP